MQISEKKIKIKNSVESKRLQTIRKWEGLPSIVEAPHIKLVYISSFNNYMYLVNPGLHFTVPFVVWSLRNSEDGLPIAIASIYFSVLIISMWMIVKRTPARIYYDESRDKTFATRLHPLIPLRFIKTDLPHHTFRKTQSNQGLFGGTLTNEKLSLNVEIDKFRESKDLLRLLSQ